MRLFSAHVLVVVAVGCTDETTLTSEERATLAEYQLAPAPPLDRSNAVAGNHDAAILGQQLFFDPRFSGALGPSNDGVTNGSFGRPGDAGKLACASCHALGRGGGDPRETPTSLGAGYTARNSITV